MKELLKQRDIEIGTVIRDTGTVVVSYVSV